MDEDERRDIRRDFREAVNMAPAELEDWLATDASKAVGDRGGEAGESTGHRTPPRLAGDAGADRGGSMHRSLITLALILAACSTGEARSRPTRSSTRPRRRLDAVCLSHLGSVDPTRDAALD
ncbi:MAG: DUF3140 domain-containing protein [bacterium]